MLNKTIELDLKMQKILPVFNTSDLSSDIILDHAILLDIY